MVEAPGPRGIAPVRIQAEGDDQEPGFEPCDLVESRCKDPTVPGPVDSFLDGYIDILSLARPTLLFIRETAEIGTGKRGWPWMEKLYDIKP
jgi:hypothetical protein